MLTLIEANESLNQFNLILLKLFIIKLLQEHVCRYITYQFKVETMLKKEIIDSVKKNKQTKIKQDVV